MSATDSKDGDGTTASNTSSTDTEQSQGGQPISWVKFPDVERAEWLNTMIRQMWPFVGGLVKKILNEKVQPIVDSSLPKIFKPFKFDHVDFGNTPPRVDGMTVYGEHVRQDEVIMDVKIIYDGDAEVKVAMTSLEVTAGIKDIKLHGTLRMIFKPLVPIVPLIGGMTLFFLDKPSLDFDLTQLANILDIPGASHIFRSVIEDLIENYLVMPNKIPIPLINSIDITALKFPMPDGVLRLYVVAARDLKDEDVVAKSDPYCKINVAHKVFKTNTMKGNCNPVWDKHYEVVIDQMHGQAIELEVMDEDVVKDDKLGTAFIGLEKLANHGSMESWLPLQDVKTGMINIRAFWFNLSKDPADLDRGVLRLYVVAARNLKVDDVITEAKSDPYCKINVANKVFTTNTIKSNCNPVWNKYYEVAVDQMHGQAIELEVMDKDVIKDDKLGTASISLEKLAKHGSMDSWLPLENVTTGEIHIRAFWFPLSQYPDDLDRTGTTLPDVSPRPRSTSLLIVYVDSAKNLPRDGESKSEPSPYVNIEVGDDKQKSMVKTETMHPRWESNFQFLVHDPREQELNIVVLDSDNDDRKLGHINYPIKDLLSDKDLTVHRPFKLSGSSADAEVTLRLSLRIMTSKTPVDPPAEEK